MPILHCTDTVAECPLHGLQKEDPELSQLREAAADTARDMKEAVTPSQEAGKPSGKEGRSIMDTVSMLPVQASCCLLGRQSDVAEMGTPICCTVPPATCLPWSKMLEP